MITIEKPKQGAVIAWSHSSRITSGYDSGRSFEYGKARCRLPPGAPPTCTSAIAA